MQGSKNGRSGGNRKKLVDQYKEHCPPGKRKDLEALIKKCGGDETKITESIREWWDNHDNPTPQEPEWEEINKKSKKKVPESRGRGNSGRGPGRGRYSRSSGGGGRGAGAERGRRGGRGGGRGGRESRGEGRKQQQPKQSPPIQASESLVEKEGTSQGIPAPAVASAPQGTWAQHGVVPLSESKCDPPPLPSPAQVPMEQAHSQPLEVPVDLTVQKLTPKNGRTSGNVWATKGSAHLIKAETAPKIVPVPPTTPAEPPTPPPESSPITNRKSQPARVAPPANNKNKQTGNDSPSTSTLESGLPASVNGANINAAGWKPASETTQLDSLGTAMAQTIVKELKEPSSPTVSVQPVSVSTVPVQAPTKKESVAPVSKPPPTNVLNMGHWETGDNDETQNLDFGFGSFGTENETPSVGETTMSGSSGANINQNSVETVSKEPASQPVSSTQQPSVSPARPPPGLSIAPLPANAVLVSDLESKLESTSLKPSEPTPQAPQESKSDIQRHTAPPGVPPQAAPIIPGGGMNQNYNTAAYGMAGMSGMYNYNAAAAGNGFVSMHGAPVLAGGIPPKPQGGIAGQPPAPSSGPPNLPQGGLYGAPATVVSQQGNDSATPSDTNSNNVTTTQPNSIPPGIPNAMPYANPAALFYGTQAYQMGQPHGVGGYGYGYGAAQFGGAVQGGFGYQQGMMGQSGAYPYDDQQQQGSNGGYQKNNSGGYRGRGGGNQYQNNYNPQGGYGAQPYGMGYSGGYGPGNMDPYMQQGAGGNFQSHSFPNDDNHHHKGGKRGGRNNGFQQQHAQQISGQQQQSFGLQGGDTNTNNNAGWSNQAGGWGGPSWPGS